jgi:hypothetical protein
MNFHRKLIQYCRKNRITGESQPTSKEVMKHDNFIGFGGRGLLIKRSATVVSRKKPGCLIFPD